MAMAGCAGSAAYFISGQASSRIEQPYRRRRSIVPSTAYICIRIRIHVLACCVGLELEASDRYHMHARSHKCTHDHDIIKHRRMKNFDLVACATHFGNRQTARS